jgi:exoribonuclease R
MNDGAFHFDKVEVKFNLSEKVNQRVFTLKFQKMPIILLKNLCLLANKKVAEFIGKQKKTFIYRIHDEPNEDKLLQCKHFEFG